MTSHYASAVQMREESENAIRKWEEMWFMMTAKMERVSGAAVTCDWRLFQRRVAATGNALSPTVDRRVRRMSRDADETERSRRLASASAGRRSSSHRWSWQQSRKTDCKNLAMLGIIFVAVKFVHVTDYFAKTVTHSAKKIGQILGVDRWLIGTFWKIQMTIIPMPIYKATSHSSKVSRIWHQFKDVEDSRIGKCLM